MSQIVKKFIGNNQVDGTKARLDNNQTLKARNAANSADVDILKVNASDRIEFSSLPQSSTAPTTGNDLVNKTYADSLSGGGATTALDNLASVAINTDLVFDAGGNGVLKTKNDSVATQGLILQSGNSSADGSGAVQILSGSADDVDSGSITIQTGDAATAISGNIVIQVGNQSAAGSRGNIQLKSEAVSVTSGDGVTPVLFLVDNGQIAMSEPTGTYRTILQPDPSLAATYTLTLPPNDGNSGDVLQTNGSGVLTFVAPAAAPTWGTEALTLNGTDITNQYKDLAQVAVTGSIFLYVNGVWQRPTTDYTISYTGGAGGKTRITFAGDLATGGGAALVSGDVIHFMYQY